MADPTLVDETFEDPIIEEQEINVEPRSESDSLPDDEPGREPPVAQSQEPPAQAAAPPSPVESSPSLPQPPPQHYAPPPPYQPPAEEFKFYTREQLQNAVDQGIIRPDQMADQLQLQLKEEAKREAVQAIEAHNRAQAMSAKIQQYHTYAPGWNQQGTPAHQRANSEYQKLLALGLSANPVTELLALEKAFGTVDQLAAQRQSADLTRETRATMPSVAKRASAPSPSRNTDPLKKLDREELRLYDKYIKAGHYQNWNEVREEIRWAASQNINADLRSKTEGLMRR